MSRQGRYAAWAAVFITIAAGPRAAEAQITGSIAGTIRDASGAVLPGATVTVRGPSLRKESAAAASGASGAYRVALIPPGVYDVTVERQGFAAQTRKDVEVAINQQTTLDFTLAVGGRTEAVEVAAEIPLVEVERSAVSSRVSQKTIDALPLNGRNYVDLISLVPGALPVPGGQQGASVSIFGERGAALSFLVDGAENNDPLNGGPSVRYTQDSVREFEVITTGYEAEFGRAQGGVANIVTRSGGNDWAGSAFTFVRNDALDSSNVPGQEPPKLERYQWGGTVGGPLKRDKAYALGSFEVLDETRGVNIDRSKIPTFVANGIATPGGKEDFSVGPGTDGVTGMLKLDFTLNDRNRLAITGARYDQDVSGEISSPVAGTIALPSAARTSTADGTSVIARETAVLRPTTFLETSASFIRGHSGANLEHTQRIEPVLILLRSGFLQTGAPFGSRSERISKRFQLAQALTRALGGAAGDHQLKLGWDVNRVTLGGFDEVLNDVEYSAAFLSPNAAAINEDLFRRLGFAQSAARFFTLSGNPDGSLDLGIKDTSLSGFAQDSWRMRHGVTLNYGLRYDWSSLFGDDKNNLAPRVGATWDVGQRHKTVVKANWGRFFDRNLLAAAATVPDKGGVFTRSIFDVTLPRLGADYTDSLIDLVITSGFPTGPGTRSPAENPAYRGFADALRADPLALYKLLGIRVSDPSVPPVVTADNVQQLSGLSPAQAVALLERTFPGTDFEFFDVPGGSIVGNRVLSFFPRGPLGLSRDVSRYAEDRTPSTNAFNVGVEQQFLNDFSLAVTYVHRRTRDLLTRRIVNLFDAAPGSPNFGKTTDGGPRISQVTYDGLINYDGVTVYLRKRFGQRYQLALSYTGSRARDNLLTGNVGSQFSNNNHPEIDYGPSNQSAPHVFVGNGFAVLPLGINLSGIVFWRSGAAFNPRGIVDLDGDGLVDQRDTTQPRNKFRTKAYGDVDVRLEKTFGVSGRQAFSVLAEAFNLLNRANVSNVTAVSGPSFGTPTTFFPGREIQFGVRYLFGRR
ncbi:MAG: hypothetical protein DMF80_18025 [Acidobacteria bacterium]|nr:MAG: hypothetical protein DMF80_18025 [Acidobacteriota bacterium]